MNDLHRRLLLAASGIGSWLMIAFSFIYLENILHLNPCPLCMMQRLAFALVGGAFLLDAALWPRQKIAQFLTKSLKYLSIFFGIGLAARHIYIQSLPADSFSGCGLDFYGLLERNSFLSTLWKSMQGTGNCNAREVWLGLTIPTWSMACFGVFLLLAIISERPLRATTD